MVWQYKGGNEWKKDGLRKKTMVFRRTLVALNTRDGIISCRYTTANRHKNILSWFWGLSKIFGNKTINQITEQGYKALPSLFHMKDGKTKVD